MRYVALYNHQLPQSALKGKTPMQAMKDWYASHPQLFHRLPNNCPGCDRYKAFILAIERKRTPGTDRFAAQAEPSPNGARDTGKSYGLVCRKERGDGHTVYQLVRENQAEIPVLALCETLKVSTSG